jgi:hypothetical protein
MHPLCLRRKQRVKRVNSTKPVLRPNSRARREARPPQSFNLGLSGVRRLYWREHPEPTMSALAPTPAHRLIDARGRPYFLWDEEMTLDELRGKLRDPDPDVRAYFLGKLMRLEQWRILQRWRFGSVEWGLPAECGTFLGVTAASDPEARRRARAHAEVRVFRPGDGQVEADADALYWDRIPVDERAELTWQLSLEVYGLAHPGAKYEPRLSRSIARLVGR